jgi:peroxiredoxin
MENGALRGHFLSFTLGLGFYCCEVFQCMQKNNPFTVVSFLCCRVIFLTVSVRFSSCCRSLVNYFFFTSRSLISIVLVLVLSFDAVYRKDMTSEDYFKGKKCVIFCLPGAFTPTCSSTHVPGYDSAYAEFKALGIDEVYCMSVNDAFVMRQWGLNLGLAEDKTVGANGFQNVKLIPDGAANFARGMGMQCVWDKERGFGERSWRYSAVINDMKIEKMFIEGGGIVQDSGPDPFAVSDAQTMLDYLKKTAAQ